MTIIYWYTVLTVLYIWDMRALPGLILYIHTYCILFNFHNFSFFPGLGIRSSVFWVNRWVFLWKNLKKFGERPERFSHIALFWRATWELTSLIKKEGTRESFVVFLLFTYKKCTKKYNFRQIFLSELIIHSFVMSDLSNSLKVALLMWATWAIRSQSFIWFGRSLQMSEWANSQTCFFRFLE